MLTEQEYKSHIKRLQAAHTLVMAFDDKELREKWLSDGLPDDTEHISVLLPNNDLFGDEYKRLMALFAWLFSRELQRNCGGVFF